MNEIQYANFTIYCCECTRAIHPILITGKRAYPHRKDLYHLPFWMCYLCECFVSCHPGTEKPLGSIASKELKQARLYIHTILDPIWQSGIMKRGQLYAKISRKLGYTYHTANIRNMKEIKQVKEILDTIKITMPSIEGDFV